MGVEGLGLVVEASAFGSRVLGSGRRQGPRVKGFGVGVQ